MSSSNTDSSTWSATDAKENQQEISKMVKNATFSNIITFRNSLYKYTFFVNSLKKKCNAHVSIWCILGWVNELAKNR